MWLFGILDGWTGFHAWAGLVLSVLSWKGHRISPSLFLAIATAWEWVEAAGYGPVGSDPNPLNSVMDVAIAAAAFAAERWRHASLTGSRKERSDSGPPSG